MPVQDSDLSPIQADLSGVGNDLYRLILNASLDAVILLDRNGRVLEWNGRAGEIFGWPALDVLGKPLADFLIPERYRERHRQGMDRFLRTGEGPILRHRVEMSALCRNGTEIPVELTVSPIRWNDDWIFMGFLRDMSAQKRTERRLEIQNTILRILTDSPTVEEMERKILEAICRLDPWRFGAFWRREGEKLVCSNTYVKPGAEVGNFQERTLNLDFRYGESFPGMIWQRGTSASVSDFETCRFPRSEAARMDHLYTAYGFPVLLGGELYGVFEFFGRRFPTPDQAAMDAISSITNQIGLYMERRFTEKALVESEERFRVLADNAPVLIWITDPEGTLTYVNRPWLDYTGHTFEAILAGGWRESIHPDDYDALLSVFRSELHAHRPIHMEFRLRDAAGTYRWFLDHGLPQFSPRGDFTGFLGVSVDIDAGKRVQEELEARERRFHALIENSADAIAIYDPGGNIVYASASTEKVIGYTDTEMIGRQAFSLIHPEDTGIQAKLIETILREPGARMDVELRLLHKDGSWRWVEGTMANFTTDPLIGGILANYRDITARKMADQEKQLAEERMRQGQKMEAVGRLAGGIAHDFNNLLTSINGYSAMALDSLAPQGQLREFLEEILKSGERAAGLTRQLLAYSRKQTLAPRPWDLNGIVAGMEGMLRRVIGEDIDLQVKPSADPCMGKVDRGQVEQILLNLVLNARDAMPEGGRLLLETANVDLDEAYVEAHPDTYAGAYVMLAVSDTGTGMSDEVKRNLFEPFFTTKEAGKGTGLGLSSVYGIVKQSGGHILVYSEPGLGTAFRIYLPRASEGDGAKPEGPKRAHPDSLRGRECILLVEDEESVRRFSVKALEILGYRVLTASNGREALDVMERMKESVRMVVTDVVMPDMGGHALAESLRHLAPDVPILFISGYTESSIAHRNLIRPGAAFLQKPFGPSELAAKVRETLDRKAVTP